MRLIRFFFIGFLAFQARELHSQNELYYGGLGRGDVSFVIENFGLNGTSLADNLPYFGGLGRGDVSFVIENFGLNGFSLADNLPYFGGLGRGDVSEMKALASLGGQIFWRGGAAGATTDWNTPTNWFPEPMVPNTTTPIWIEPNNNGHDPVLDQPRIVHSIQFRGANKKVVLGNFNLTLTDTLFGTDANNYVQTNGTGKLVRNLNSGEAFIFPVGNSRYNPVTLTNHTGSADTFSVRVFDAVYANGSSGALIQTPHVKLTWDISKNSGSAAAGQGVDFKFQWNASQESAGMADYVLNHHDGNVWEIPTAMGAPTLMGTTDKFFTVPQYQGTFSPFAIGDSPTSPLPITLSAFTAQCMQGKVTLQWTTAAEINNALFQMERSSDLLDWTLWSTVAGAGHSSTVRSYSLTDTERPEGTVYYRLSQVDFDGTTTYFAPVAVSCEGGQTQQVRVYPNPASEMVYIACSGVAADGPGELRLVDMQGRVWYSREMQWSAGSQTLSLEVSDVPSGVYQIQLWQGDRLWPVMRVVVM